MTVTSRGCPLFAAAAIVLIGLIGSAQDTAAQRVFLQGPLPVD